MPNKMERFTEGARLILLLAQNAAEVRKSRLIEPLHILLALTQYRHSDAGVILFEASVTLAMVQAQIDAEPVQPPLNPNDIELSPKLKRTLELAVEEARHVGQSQIGSVNLLLGVIRAKTSPVQTTFRQAIIDEDTLMRCGSISISTEILARRDFLTRT